VSAIQAAIAACDVDGKCRCGEVAGHVGWLICMEQVVNEWLDNQPKVGVPRDAFAGADRDTEVIEDMEERLGARIREIGQLEAEVERLTQSMRKIATGDFGWAAGFYARGVLTDALPSTEPKA
jgi:hypothetical protein